MAKSPFQIALEKKLAEAGVPTGSKPKSSGSGRLQREGAEFKPSSQSDSTVQTSPTVAEEGPSTLVKVGVGLLGLGALVFLGSFIIKSRSS